MDNMNSITSLGGDKFTINNQVMGLAELIMLLEIDRANNLEIQLANELQNMANLNGLLKKANEMLALARTEKGQLTDDKFSHMPQDMIDFMKANDIQQGLGKWDNDHTNTAHKYYTVDSDGHNFYHNTDQWETTIENVKGFIDGLNSRSQLDMIRVSSLMKKRDESLTMPSNTNSNVHQTNQSIISKL